MSPIDQSNRHKRRIIRRAIIWGTSALVLVAAVWGIGKLANSVPSAPSGTLVVPVNDSDNVLGSADAPITLVEYSDFQCPACGAFHTVLEKLLAEPDAKGKIKLVYRNFPLQQHANAQIAAQAAQAAGLQGKFWEMHDKLFENQTVWSGQSNAAARQAFIGYAKALSLNIERFNADIDSQAVKDKINADRTGGVDSNIDATPTFFVNGIKMPQPQSYEEFKSFVLNGVPTRTP